MKSAIKHIVSLFACGCWLFTSCNTDVELCEEDFHPHWAMLAFQFDWENGEVPTNKPDSMMIIANRIINSWRTGFVIEVPSENGATIEEGDTFFGELIVNKPVQEDNNDEEAIEPSQPSDEENPATEENEAENRDEESEEGEGNEIMEGEEGKEEESEELEEEETPAPPIPDKALKVKGGDYQFVAISHDYDACGIEKLDSFQKDNSIRAKDLYVKYKTRDKGDKKNESYGRSWIDYNSYGQYTAPAMKPTYYAFVGKETVLANDIHTIRLEPHQITQEYTITFQIEKEYGVKIDTIVGILSGIPERFGLTTQHVDVSRTNKMVFIPDANYDGSTTTTLLECSRTVNAIGLVHSKGPGYTQGPGILQLCIYTSTQNEEGQTKTKTIYAIINLYNKITSRRPLLAKSNGEYVIQNGKKFLIDIENILKIEKGEILEDANEDNSLDVWKRATTFNVDI